MIEYVPEKYTEVEKRLNVMSAWIGLERIIGDIKKRFNIGSSSALEFGTGTCYSAVALSNYFDSVVTVDSWVEGGHQDPESVFKFVKEELLFPYKNITPVLMNYHEYIKQDNKQYDLIHIDIEHTYEQTFPCGDWAMQHADIVIFHDYPIEGVGQSLRELSKKYKVNYHYFPPYHGLGILSRKDKT